MNQPMNPEVARRMQDALWRLYGRPQPPPLPAGAANFPWDDPEFSERMLREHLDPSHGAASRQQAEIRRSVDWLWNKLSLREGSRVLDVTCGPGLYAVELARRGCRVHGIDFSPASIRYARQLAADQGVADRCTFELRDVRTMEVALNSFDTAIFLYGQLAVFTPEEAAALLSRCAQALYPSGSLIVELLNFEHIDKTSGSWWFTDHSGLWGDSPFLHLGERHWFDEQSLSLEQFHIINLETGELTEYALTDQAYRTDTMVAMMKTAGFGQVGVYPGWDSLDLYDANEWVVYLAAKG
jgi:2-polyprenyl-3-methyl-5-hydroxy-6-metoxy-1,4-benzoquinol methylase